MHAREAGNPAGWQSGDVEDLEDVPLALGVIGVPKSRRQVFNLRERRAQCSQLIGRHPSRCSECVICLAGVVGLPRLVVRSYLDDDTAFLPQTSLFSCFLIQLQFAHRT